MYSRFSEQQDFPRFYSFRGRPPHLSNPLQHPPPWDPPSHSRLPIQDLFKLHKTSDTPRHHRRTSSHKLAHSPRDIITIDSMHTPDKRGTDTPTSRKRKHKDRPELEKRSRLSQEEIEPGITPSQDLFQELTDDIKIFEKDNSPTQHETSNKLDYCNFLSDVCRSIYNPRFIVFGSSLNGFSTQSSDVDITLLVEERELYRNPLRKVYKSLSSFTSRVSDCQLINAKVPIVMFEDLQYGFEVDISINNNAGIRNTFLLRTYSRLDPRVRPLVIVVKEWAKSNNVCNSKSGLLSSYALSLMVLFFLQHHVSPQVLPSLQRMYPDMYNAYYTIDDIQRVNVKEICDSWNSENTESVGELLIKFFDFYSKLDFRDKLISIRTGSLHERPSWEIGRGYKGYINIEEPYTLDNAARSVYLLTHCKGIINEFKRKHRQLTSKGKVKNLKTVFSQTTY